MSVSKEASFGGWDGKEYHAYACSLLAHNWDHYERYFNNIRPPFYPIFLVPFVAVNDQVVWHIQLAQSLLGVCTAVVIAKLVGRWSGQAAGNCAFLVILFHPFLIYQSAFVLTESLFVLLLWLGIACLQRLSEPGTDNEWRWVFAAALTLGLGCLTRPSLQVFLPVTVVWLGWQAWRQGSALALKRMAVFTLLVSVLLLPWMVNNLRVHGEFSLAPGAAQTAYALSNSPEYLRMYEAQTKAEYYEEFERLVARFSVQSGTTRSSWMEAARDFRQNHPRDWWRLQWYKFKHFWTPWLNPLIFSRGMFLISVFTVTPLFLLGPLEIIRRRLLADAFVWLLLGLIAVGYVVGGLLFHVQVRYRFPFVDMAFIVLTASLLGRLRLVELLKSRWSRPLPLLASSPVAD